MAAPRKPATTAESDATAAFRRELAAISADYRRELPARLAAIEAQWRSLATGAADGEALRALQRELHSLAGSARTLGVAGVSEAAARADDFLEPYSVKGAVPVAGQRRRFAALLRALALAAAGDAAR